MVAHHSAHPNLASYLQLASVVGGRALHHPLFMMTCFVSQLDNALPHVIGHSPFLPDPSGGLILHFWDHGRLVVASNGSITQQHTSATQGWVLLGKGSHQHAQEHGFLVSIGGQPITSLCPESGG